MAVGHLALALHESVQHRLQSRHIMRDGAWSVLIAGDSHKPVSRSRKIDLQPVCPVVDVIDSLVKDIIRIDLKESPQAAAGRGTLKISVFEDSKHGSGHIVQCAVLPDAMVNVNGPDPGSHPDTDPIIAAHGVGFHGVCEIRKRVRVVCLCFPVGSRLIGNLGQSGRFGAALHLPGAKPTGTL